MAFHEFKGWEPGPADATHFSVQDVGVPWLKVDDDGVYFAWSWPHKNWKWSKYDGRGERDLAGAIVKQPIEVIRGVEVNWEGAPEGTTHVVIVHGVFHGWRKYTPKVMYHWRNNGWVNSGAVPYLWLDINKGLIFEHPNIRGDNPQAPAAKQEAPKPAPKKQVGWWS